MVRLRCRRTMGAFSCIQPSAGAGGIRLFRFSISDSIPLDEAYPLYRTVGMLRDRSRDQWEREMGRTAFYAAAHGEGKLVGLARGVTSGLMGAGIWDVMVDPACRSQGVGSRLVTLAVEELLRRGVKDIALQCEPELEPFYRRLGFVRGPWGMHYAGLAHEPLEDGFFS